MQYSQHPNNIISIMLELQPIPQGGGTAALATHPPPNMVPPVPFDGTCIAREGEFKVARDRDYCYGDARLTNTHVRYKINQERDKESRFKRCMK